MEFRTAQRIAALLVVALPASAVTVWHKHAHGGAEGSLEISATGLQFSDKKHKGEWKWDEIQQVTLSKDELSLLTYEDRPRLFGRDREYHFQELPEGFATTIRESLRANLQGRFISGLPAGGEPVWQVPARLLESNKGVLGTLAYRPGSLSFTGGEKTRTWPIEDIENVSSSAPLELMVATYEKYGRLHGGNRQVRFQLRTPIRQEQYQALWRDVNRVQGLQILETK